MGALTHADDLGAECSRHRNARPRSPAANRFRLARPAPPSRRDVSFPLLERHDRASFNFTCYSDVATPDEATHALRRIVEGWRNVRKMSDAELADQFAPMRSTSSSISMHSANNRLLTFAEFPHHFQVSYLGYPGTTGMTAMDYRLTDPHLDPPGGLQPYVRPR